MKYTVTDRRKDDILNGLYQYKILYKLTHIIYKIKMMYGIMPKNVIFDEEYEDGYIENTENFDLETRIRLHKKLLSIMWKHRLKFKQKKARQLKLWYNI